MADLLRAIPLDWQNDHPRRWLVQNPVKGTEYEVDVEGYWCQCPHFQNKRRCKHANKALQEAKRFRGRWTEAEFEAWLERAWKEWR
jgi:hypothetical protein